MCPDCNEGYKDSGDPCDTCYTTVHGGPLGTKNELLLIVIKEFTDLELEPLLRMAARIAMGNKRYGHLTDLDSRDWFKEEGYEQADTFVYHVWEDMKREAETALVVDAAVFEPPTWIHPCGNIIEYPTQPGGCENHSKGCLYPDKPWQHYGSYRSD